MEKQMSREKKDSTMTSINIDAELYRTFKRQAIDDGISLTLLVTRAINTYLTGSQNNKALDQVKKELHSVLNWQPTLE